MKPLFHNLKKSHYSSNKISSDYVGGDNLYKELGYDIGELMKQNSGYENTCATRMSLALIKAGIHFSGRMKIKVGPYKGKTFEAGAKLLADQLAKPNVLGRPEIIQPVNAINRLFGKKGVIFFWKIDGYDGGHIDLIEVSNTMQVCHSACYFACKEIWFWELQ